MTRKSSRWVSGTAISIILTMQAFPSGALAQDLEGQSNPPQEAQDRGQINQIVVVAQKRAENVQDVPITIAAFTGDALAEQGVSTVNQMANLTPNVQLSNSSQFFSSPSMLSGFIRGIGQDEFALNFEPGVGTYIDGVYLARAAGANIDLMDVERVEILKGPQGTLFGRNTIGGAISVVTREPAAEFGIAGNLAMGSYNRFDASAIVDLPISENLHSSVAFSSKHRKGWQERRVFPGANGFAVDSPTFFEHIDYTARNRSGGYGEQSVRGKLKFDDGGDLRATFSLDYMNMDTSGTPTTLLALENFSALGAISGNDNLGPANGFGANPTIVGAYNLCISTPQVVLASLSNSFALVDGLPVDLLNLCNSPRTGTTAIGSVNVDGDPANDRLPLDDRYITGDYDFNYGTGVNFAKSRNYGANLTLDWDFAEAASLKSISSYRYLYTRFGQDADGSPVGAFEGSFYIRSKQLSQEFQLTGEAFDDRLNYVFGLYYFRETGDEKENVLFPGGLIQINLASDIRTNSYAAFTHLNYRVTDWLGVTLGARYTKEDKSIAVSQRDINLFYSKLGLPVVYPVPSDLTQFYPQGRFTQSFDNFSPRIGLEVHLSDDVMAYGSYSRGFKSGGWTTRIAGPTLEPLEFQEEEVETYEVGLKSQFFDRRMQLNMAAFSSDYSDVQLQVQRGISPQIENAGLARIRGFEVETIARPVPWFQLDASVGYIDAKYLSVDDPTGVIAIGNMLPKVPKWTANIAPSLLIELENGGEISIRGDYTYKSNMALDSENTPFLFTGKQENTNASISYKAPEERWGITAGVTNLFDNRFLINGGSQRNGGSGVTYGIPNRPREYYASLKFEF